MTAYTPASTNATEWGLTATEGKRIPRTAGWPLIGSLPGLIRSKYEFFKEAHQTHGDLYGLNLGLSEIIVCNHPAHIQHILRDNVRNYAKRGPLWSILENLVGNGLVISDGKFWLRQRRMMQPQFHRTRLAALNDLMTSAIDHDLSNWDSEADSVELMHLFTQLAMRISVRTMFGTSLGTAQMDEIGTSITRAFDFMLRFMVTRSLPKWLPDLGRKQFYRDLAVFDEAVYQMIDEQRRGTSSENHLLAMLLDVVDEETGEGMTDKQLRDEVATLFVAGFETTTTALAWSTYYLATHPKSWQKVVAEVDTVLEGRVPTFADLPQLTYTRMVLQEAIRLRPPAWFTPRQAVEDDVIDGFRIPAGSDIALMKYMVHRHPAHWENPEQFEPERFSKERSANRHRFAWVPFGAGQRICIGREFAMMEGQLTLAMLAQRFCPQPAIGFEPKPKLSGTYKTSNGVHVQLKAR